MNTDTVEYNTTVPKKNGLDLVVATGRDEQFGGPGKVETERCHWRRSRVVVGGSMVDSTMNSQINNTNKCRATKEEVWSKGESGRQRSEKLMEALNQEK